MKRSIRIGALTALTLVAGIALAAELKVGDKAPDLKITGARGVSESWKLADAKGKWVVLDFWAHWCKPCTGMSMPAWMKFAEEHKAQQDQFVIVAVHDPSIKTMEALDEQITAKHLKEKSWGGKDIPFPILLDTTSQTVKAYNISGFPTAVLIDPEGKIALIEVGAGRGQCEKLLAEKLKASDKKADADKSDKKNDDKDAKKDEKKEGDKPVAKPADGKSGGG